MESPWSTPTQSEIGEAEAALNKGANLDLFDGLDSDPSLIRELGDGEPSFDASADDLDYMASSNNNHDDDDYRSSSRAANKSKGPKKSPRGASKSPEKRASRSPTKGSSRKLKKQASKLETPGEHKQKVE